MCSCRHAWKPEVSSNAALQSPSLFAGQSLAGLGLAHGWDDRSASPSIHLVAPSSHSVPLPQLRIQTQVPRPVQQALYPLSSLPDLGILLSGENAEAQGKAGERARG